jgi:hypothetical protein
MKRFILFALVALGYTFVSCKPKGDQKIYPTPSYAPVHEEYTEKQQAEEALAAEGDSDFKTE